MVTHQELLELRKELNGLVAAWHHQTGQPHGTIHNELRRVCGGPLTAQATGQLKERIKKVKEWATRMRDRPAGTRPAPLVGAPDGGPAYGRGQGSVSIASGRESCLPLSGTPSLMSPDTPRTLKEGH